MMGYLLMKKREDHQQRKNWSDKYFCCITRCHLLSLVVIRYQAFVVPLVVTRFTTRLSFYKQSFLYCFIKLKFTKLCLFIHFRWIDVKSNRCFGGLYDLSNLIRIL